jgi:hypothetical protein
MKREAMRRKEFMPVFKGVAAEIIFAAAIGVIGVLICALIASTVG